MSIVLHRKDGVRVLLIEGLVLSERDIEKQYTETFTEVCVLAGAKEDSTPGDGHVVRGVLYREMGMTVADAFRLWPADEQRAFTNAYAQPNGLVATSPIHAMNQAERRRALDLPPIKPAAAPSPKG